MSLRFAFERLEWMDDALCRGMDPWAFFDRSQVAKNEAIKICNACPVRDVCLDYALTHGMNGTDDGVWGGKTPSQRRRLRRLRLAQERGA